MVDHDLRLVVGHANLLDGLMLELANLEQEQEISFNNTVQSAANPSEEPKNSELISLTDQLIHAKERAAEDEIHQEIKMAIPVSISAARPIKITITEDDDQETEDDELDSEVLFTSTDLCSSEEHSPPDLVFEDSSDASDASDSEEDSIRPSLQSIEPLILEEQRKAITTAFCQSPSKSIDCSFSYLKDTSSAPVPPRGFRPGALLLMIWCKIQHSCSKQLRTVPDQASTRTSTV